MSHHHLNESELAGYLDQDLTADEERRIEAHLDVCAACRAELVEVMRLARSYALAEAGSSPALPPAPHARSQRPVRRWRVGMGVAGVLAAGVATVFFSAAPPTTRAPHADVVRAPIVSPIIEERQAIAIVEPADRALIDAGSLVFTWRAARADMYRVTVLAESGEPVWTAETADTSIALAASVALAHGRPYFWRVDGIAEGITVSTGVHLLRMRP